MLKARLNNVYIDSQAVFVVFHPLLRTFWGQITSALTDITKKMTLVKFEGISTLPPSKNLKHPQDPPRSVRQPHAVVQVT